MKIIGIDPGINATGYSIIKNGRAVFTGTIRPRARLTYKKIGEICKRLESLIGENQPDYAVLEKVFYRKNIRTLICSSELRGAIILTISRADIKLLEYTPAQIKLAITGNGRASKRQVRYIVERTFLDDSKRNSSHAIDAVAIAGTAYRRLKRSG